MHSRVARVMLAALLLAVGTGAALQLNFLLAESRQLADAHQALLTHLARFDAIAADLSAAQAAYVAPGQPDAPWLDRVSSLLPQLTTEVTAVRAGARSADAATRIQVMSEAALRLGGDDAMARDHLRQEQDLLAADVVFGEALNAITTGRAAAVELGNSERATFAVARGENRKRVLWVAGGAASLWVVGLILLVPRTSRADEVTPSAVDVSIARAADPVAKVEESPTAPIVDLAAAADLCTDLSRVASSTALPDMLARAAALLDASGVIVWLGNADELFAATSHGYDPRVISRLGSIPRNADNATAAAWRTGDIRTVAGDAMSNGAIVAPMFGPENCIGVLAAEVRHGREQDPSTQAVTMMVAAQLATVLAAWPSAPAARAAEA